MSIYTQIKEAVSVPEAAERYGLSVTRNGMTRCPFHEDHSPSLKLNEDTGSQCRKNAKDSVKSQKSTRNATVC